MSASEGRGVRQRGSRSSRANGHGLHGQGRSVCKRGSKASRCPPRGSTCLRAKGHGRYGRRPLFRERGSWCLRVAVPAKVADFASEGPRSPRARCRARLYTCRERGSFDGLVRLVHVPKVEETRTILDFLWYGRVTDQRRVESTFDVRCSIGQRRRFESPARCALFPYAIIKPRPAASRSNHLRLSMVD